MFICEERHDDADYYAPIEIAGLHSALRRHSLDLPVPAALPHWTSRIMDNHENQLASHRSAEHLLHDLPALMVGDGASRQGRVATIDLGIMNNVIMLAIADVKASLVVLFFMHVKYSSKLTWVVVSGAIFFPIIMIVLTLNDYIFRGVASSAKHLVQRIDRNRPGLEHAFDAWPWLFRPHHSSHSPGHPWKRHPHRRMRQRSVAVTPRAARNG